MKLWGAHISMKQHFFLFSPAQQFPTHTHRLFFFSFFSSFSFESITLWNYSSLPPPSCRQHSRPPFPNSIPDMYNCCLQLLLFFAAVSTSKKLDYFLQKNFTKNRCIFFSLFVSLRHLEGNGNENTEKGDFSSILLLLLFFQSWHQCYRRRSREGSDSQPRKKGNENRNPTLFFVCKYTSYTSSLPGFRSSTKQHTHRPKRARFLPSSPSSNRRHQK